MAARTGTTPRTIRYYEEIGLLPSPAGHEKGRHRTYGEADVQRLEELLRLRELLGVTLEELKELAERDEARSALRAEWQLATGVEHKRRLLSESLEHIGRQLELVRTRRSALGELERGLLAKRDRVQELLGEL